MILQGIISGAAGLVSSRSGSPNNPSTPLSSPAAWLWDAFGASETDTGVSVSPSNALGYSGYLACVKVISETLATLPLKVYRRTEDDGRELARDRPIYTLLHDRPNELMSSFTFREVLTHHLVGWGNAYAEIERDKRGRIIALWPIPPDRVQVKVYMPTKAEAASGRRPEKWLKVRVGSEERVLAPGYFTHIPGLGYDGFEGYSAVQLYRKAVGLGLATEKYGARWFAGGGKPPVVLRTQRVLNREAVDRLRLQWERQHGNLESANRAVILDEGMELDTIGLPPEDSQFLQTRKFQLSELARIYRIPAHKVGDLERATFSNIEAQAIEFVQDVVLVWAKRWEQTINWDLFSAADRGTLYAEFSLDGLLRGDSKTRAEANAILRSWGILSANEWRRGENLDPVEGGDEFLVPLNMRNMSEQPQPQDESDPAPVADPPDEPDEPAPDEEEPQVEAMSAAIWLPILKRAAEHYAVREARLIARELKRSRDLADFQGRVEELLTQVEVWIEQELESISEALQRAGLVDDPVEWMVLAVRRHLEGTRDHLAQAVAVGDVEAWVADMESRAAVIAADEVRRLRGAA